MLHHRERKRLNYLNVRSKASKHDNLGILAQAEGGSFPMKAFPLLTPYFQQSASSCNLYTISKPFTADFLNVDFVIATPVPTRKH
jgi:hypothetical protein